MAVVHDMVDPGIDFVLDPLADDDESSPFGFNEDFESECYGDIDED